MDRAAAQRHAEAAIQSLMSAGYDTLVGRIDERNHSHVGDGDNESFHVETWIYWDDEEARTVRLWAVVDDGKLRAAMSPLTVCEIVDPPT